MENNFELSELSKEMLLSAYTYYNRGRFWKYDFDEWLLKEFKPIRNDNGVLVDLEREYKDRYGYTTEHIRSYGYDRTFVKLYNEAK